MNRYLVLETFAEGQAVKMQVLDTHASVHGAYWHWHDPRADKRLKLVDLKSRIVYDWPEVFRLMCAENLLRLCKQMRITPQAQAVLLTLHYIDAMSTITQEGHTLLAQYYQPEPLMVQLGFIQSTSQLYK